MKSTSWVTILSPWSAAKLRCQPGGNEAKAKDFLGKLYKNVPVLDSGARGATTTFVALGYTMVYGVLNLINFAHGDVLMIGAMVGLTVVNLLQSMYPGLPGYVDLAIAIAVAVPACMLVNVIIERVAYRRLRNAPRLAPLITAIGVSMLLQTFAMMIWGRSPLPFPHCRST